MKSFKEGELVLWMLKAMKIKGEKFKFHGKVLIKYKKFSIITRSNYPP
jgi:hypothetical protein